MTDRFSFEFQKKAGHTGHHLTDPHKPNVVCPGGPTCLTIYTAGFDDSVGICRMADGVTTFFNGESITFTSIHLIAAMRLVEVPACKADGLQCLCRR